ncbi:hypothetical protein K1719_025827 [Acacia pycnantha]|nr:hypothetical protein K1719_025827 [Acacia pycnantha]
MHSQEERQTLHQQGDELFYHLLSQWRTIHDSKLSRCYGHLCMGGYPDIFITFTCNPMWHEITRHCDQDGLKPCDRPEILSRIFNFEVAQVNADFEGSKIFGSIKAMYTLLSSKKRVTTRTYHTRLSESDKIRSSFEVDQLISQRYRDKLEDPELYELVGSYMVHGPCGRSSRSAPCMKDGKCSKYFPKRFCARTMLDEHGYPTYRRRDDGHMVSRKGVKLDNRSVVPYNATLLKLFGGHLNIEKTNQSRAIKYLFKYISKGNDRVIAGIYNKNDQPGSQQSFDEISHYLNCRYVSSCEASWRIFGFDIHHRHPPVERLSFHLPQQQSIYYKEGETMSSLVNNPRVKESMFLAWFDKNKDDPFARTLTYSQFPNYFTFVREKRFWKIRERGFSVGRMGHCTPAQGELYYLRHCLQEFVGQRIMKTSKLLYCSFSNIREACFALGLLDDDKEYIDAIKEASSWASGNYLRHFFTSMLLSHCLSQPAIVWEQTKELICEDLLHINHGDKRFQGWCTVMLIRNIDQAAGMCNGTRLQISQLGKNVIKAKALNGTSIGEEILIHRMDMNPSETKLPFNMTRRQFPIIISFAMTINKSQGQSMTNVGLYLPSPVFSHGQLYVALSRVKNFNGLKILILNEFSKCSNTTLNVVYREVFQNLVLQS